MRITRVAGSNLASLETFDIDFEAEPLRSAGLFAITGPTGSGKSTLLDAICVALYDETPRLSGRSSVQVIDGVGADGAERRIGTNDVASLLRRGAGEGWAEVDFVGIDGQRYRSRWSIRRAGSKANGKLQAQTLALHKLDAAGTPVEAIGGTKSDTLRCLELRLGLKFAQFRRAVMLAQGDFAAFLKAPPSERAELLERMTGTELYGEISRQAHLEAKTWSERRPRLQARRDALQALSAEERVALEQTRAEAVERDRSLDQALVTSRAAADWHRATDERAGAVATAKADCQSAHAVRTAAEALAIELEAVVSARTLRSPYDRALQARRKRESATTALETAVATAETARKALSEAQAELDQDVLRLRAAEAAQVEAAPKIRDARALDVKLTLARKQSAETGAQAAAARKKVEDAQAVVAQAQAEAAHLQAHIAAHDQWLAAHAGDVWLADERGAVVGPLEDASKLAAQVLRQRAHAQEAHATKLAAEGAAAQTRSAVLQSTAAANEAAAAMEALQAGHDPERGAALADARQACDRLRAVLTQAVADAHARAEATAALADVAREHAGQAEIMRRSEALAAQRRTESASCQGRLAEAEDALRRMQAALDFGQQRDLLVEGEACPLCGAHEHPYAAEAPNPAVLEQRERVQTLQRELDSAKADIVRAEAEHLAASRQIADLATKAEGWRRRADQAAERWVATAAERALAFAIPDALRDVGPHGLDAGEEPNLDEPTCEAALRARQDELDIAIAALQRRSQAWLDGAKKIAAAQTLADKTRRANDQARSALERLQQDIEAAQRRADVTFAELAQTESRLQEIEARLAPLWVQQPSWQPRFAAAAAQLRDEVVRIATEVARRRSDNEAHRARAQEVGNQLAGLHASAQALVANAQSLHAAAEEHQAQAQALQTQRDALLDGESADALEQRLAADVVGRTQALDAARGRYQQHTAADASAAEAAKAAQSLHTDCRAEQQSDDAALARLLAQLELDEATLAARLAHDEAWLERRTAQIRALDVAVQRAEGAVQKAEQSLATHLQSAVPALTAADAQQRLTELSGQRDALQQQIGGIQRQLADDDGRRTEADRLDAELQVHDLAARPWLQLQDLIGSADGKVFRLYAQGLTLDVLVAHANSHLRELSRRYRLQRVPGADLELQIIDGDMADEVRALTTLSGGETFLVSLALALGLASLSSRATAIESLFIDEGFGTLDPETLEVAMAALDGLQQSGRKVGVISHVPGLAEQLGVQIAVRSRGAGRSEVSVRAGRS